jgi:hypothetical protein
MDRLYSLYVNAYKVNEHVKLDLVSMMQKKSFCLSGLDLIRSRPSQNPNQ